MSPKSNERRVVRKAAHEIKRSSQAELAKLAAVTDAGIDTSELAERTASAKRLVRDGDGRIMRSGGSAIREAILAELKRRGTTGYQLWIEARKLCRTIPESAVYEFLAGKRQVGLAYLDAMLEALELTVGRRG